MAVDVLIFHLSAKDLFSIQSPFRLLIGGSDAHTITELLEPGLVVLLVTPVTTQRQSFDGTPSDQTRFPLMSLQGLNPGCMGD